MKLIYIISLILSASLNAYSQAWVWKKQINTSNNKVTVDPNGNIFLIGTIAAPSGAFIQIQLSKYTKDGLLIWAKILTKPNTFSTPPFSLVADKNGNVYIYSTGFDSINHQFTGVKTTGITKFGINGYVVWHKNYSASGDLFPIKIDDNNNLYVGFSNTTFSNPVVTLDNITATMPGIYNKGLSIGSLSADGTARWVRLFPWINAGGGLFATATSMSVAGNKLFLAGHNVKYTLALDNSIFLGNGRCSAWFAAFNCGDGQTVWGKTHSLFIYCNGIYCNCYNPSINANATTGKVALTNYLNGAFVFKPQDTIASIMSQGLPTVKPYYTIYDTSGQPLKGKIIDQSIQGYGAVDLIAGSRGNHIYLVSKAYSDSSLIKVDTGFNRIWKIPVPYGIDDVDIPNNSNDIVVTYYSNIYYPSSTPIYLGKIVDSAAVISGRTYADWDNNGIFSPSDTALNHTLITTDNPVVNSLSSNDSGMYYMYAAPGVYNMNANFPHPYYQFLPATHTITVNQLGDTISGKDFRLRPLFAFTDVSVNFSSLSVARPGGNASYNVTVKNIGATPTSIDVGLKLPPLTSYSSVIGGTVTVNAPDSITIAMGTVNPFATKAATLFLNISTTATTNDTLRYYPKAYPYVTDTIKQDNRDTLIQAVRTSFDPNEKEVNVQKQSYADTGKAIIYTVHFQNTGNDTAFYVRIADTLSSKHDIRTFNFINASDPVSTEVKNNIINFIFNPVILPDSGHNEPKSHGFVKFSIKPKLPISITDTLYNNAAIYFDYNSPVITNRVKSWYYIPPPPPVIVLLSFTGQIQGNTVRLNFTTGSEPGLLNFVIERSTDSINYIPLGTINSAGTSTTGSSYQFIDTSPDPVADFYRLKIVYTDGRTAYSSVVVIRFPIPPPTIVLLSFTGDKQGSAVLLKFVTASEPGLLNFVIERSIDSINYIPLGTINSAGTSTTGSSYQFIDASPDPVANFYRLKIVYTDGRIAYSGIVIIKYSISPPSDITVIKVYPNPVKGIVYISIKNAPDPKVFDCTLADAAGKIVWTATVNTSVSDIHPLNTNFLSDGIYFLTLAHKSFAYRKLITVIH